MAIKEIVHEFTKTFTAFPWTPVVAVVGKLGLLDTFTQVLTLV